MFRVMSHWVVIHKLNQINSLTKCPMQYCREFRLVNMSGLCSYCSESHTVSHSRLERWELCWTLSSDAGFGDTSLICRFSCPTDRLSPTRLISIPHNSSKTKNKKKQKRRNKNKWSAWFSTTAEKIESLQGLTVVYCEGGKGRRTTSCYYCRICMKNVHHKAVNYCCQ